MENLERAKVLFKRYLDRTASSDELDEMFQLLRNRSVVESLYDLFEQEWESEDVTFLLENKSWEEIQLDWEKSQQNKSLKHASKSIGILGLFWKITAAASVLLVIGLSVWLVLRPVNQVFETGYGETLEIVLDDDSRVMLNANSRLIWYSDWRDKRERIVELEGEAFFEVNRHALNVAEHSKSSNIKKKFMPFKVITPDLTVNVLGTSFNVLARRQKTDVFLKSGEVLLTMNDSRGINSMEDNPKVNTRSGKPAPDSIYLAPGDHVSFSGASRLLDRYEDRSSQDQASWIDGFLVYDNDRLETVLQDLEDIYGKAFDVSDRALLDRKVNLGLPYEDWETVSGLMTLSLEIEMIEADGHIIVKRKQGK